MNIDPKLIIEAKSLCLFDDIAAMIAFKNNPKAVERVVRIVLSRNDIVVEKVDVQKHLKNILGHSVIFDVVAYETNGNPINIEIQRVADNKTEFSRRMMFYGSSLLLSSLEKCKTYKESKNEIVIFLVDFDVIGESNATDTFMMRCEDGMLLPEANLTLVVANGTYCDTIESEISLLYRDFHEKDIDKIRFPERKEGSWCIRSDEND